MRIHQFLAIAGIATFGAAFGVANAQTGASGGATGSTGAGASTGTTAGSSSTTPATPATPASPAQDSGPATINPPGGDDGMGASIQDPNSRSGASANLKQKGNSATATASGALDFGTIDKNTDGMLTRGEATASKNKDLAKSFDRLDGNHDGRLDDAEFAQFSATGSVTSPSTSTTTDSKSSSRKK